MESQSNQPPLVTIVGETASGKSALALELARQFNGEIIAADSRTIYKGMDIGTAKPTAKERSLVPHHLLDIIAPDQPFTVADFKKLAYRAIDDIASRGKVPFLVGGTGLYIDAVLYDFSFSTPGDPILRQKWQRFSVEELQAEVLKQGIALPANMKNPRHLIRALETNGRTPTNKRIREHTLVIGLIIDHEELEKRIEERIDSMFADGLEQEARLLGKKYGWKCTPMQAIGYREFESYSRNTENDKDFKGRIKKNTLQLAKRQRTWFKRNNSIHWVKSKDEAVDLITTFLNK